MTSPQEPLFPWLCERIQEFALSPANDMGFAEPEPYFDAPLLGVAVGDDPLWEQYKEWAIGEFHWTPLEAFLLAFPHETVRADELAVLVWVLPQTPRTKADNSKETRLPSERWGRAKLWGEEKINNGLRKGIVEWLLERGVQAMAPMHSSHWGWVESPLYEYASCWSERHAAHAAGLGTFGLSGGLITPAGMAVRVGSVVVRASLPVTPRPYKLYNEYCLYYQDGSCGECVKRCPVQSVRFEGRIKERCKKYIYGECQNFLRDTWGLDTDGCGLCQTNVPCASGIPGK